ncbi:Hsp70 family protein [Actinomadura xylanilytica]|uniref:Hsp70 family protein n=1 Tax=Actinomadura xylanilytica TaxID=887459 RepID=UPI00255AC279|nr:Hsp70 family protein [Actinomadura xylanilytica]MDL4775367.1 Hsp70 family protein [Actinomadura xylanilytica]
MPVRGWGSDRRLRRLEAAFAGDPPAGRQLEKAARDYVRALERALGQDPALALRLFRAYDSRVPGHVYAAELPAGHAELLAGLAAGTDADALTVTFELATRLGSAPLQRAARDRLADVLGGTGDADRLVAQLDRWRGLGLLDRDTVARSLRGHLPTSPLARDEQLWTGFLSRLPGSALPELFEVHAFLGNGAEAVRLADTAVRREEAMRCCLRSPRLDDVRAGLELASREGAGILADLAGRAADLHFGRGEYAEALPHYRAAGRPDRLSECHERLGRFGDALAACPDDRPDRLERLAGACWPEVDALVERREYAEAAVLAETVVRRLALITGATGALAARRAELTARRAAVVQAGRRHYAALAEPAGPSDDDVGPAVHLEWSRFEEGAGETSAAAEQAEHGGDLYRAHGLYLKAGRHGDAERVLRGDPDGWDARAGAREAGGDLVGAAELYAAAGRPEEAAGLYLQAGRPAEAARSLIAWRGDDAIEDPRLADCLRRSGDTGRLAALCLAAVERHGRDTAGFAELRRLRDEAMLPPDLEPDVRRCLEALGTRGREPFEARAAAWTAQAIRDVDRRYAGIWALDLGTTTCAVSIYDGATKEPVLCPWKGHPYFASTLTLDEAGNERVGIAGEEVLASWVKGHISAAKRRIGGLTRYRVRGRVYRTEEVAARLIGHARGMVEDFLAERVLEAVADLARAELGEVRDEWLGRLAEGHDLRVERPRAVLTIPAFFRNNQKQATRNACAIAGVELARLIHEPTAACITAARQRRLSGEVVVVDLGAGTLDISALWVDGRMYDVHQVGGDTGFGGADFDAIIVRALEERLARTGVTVPAKGRERRRFEIAAEYLKIGLSGQHEVDYPLPGFNGDPGFRLSLSRDELTGILAGPLDTLRTTCRRLRDSLKERPEHLVLVGGPMLAPYVREAVEEVFGLRRTVLSDPRTAVARGAATQAAVLSGALREQVLMDVTPLALGLLVAPSPGAEEFSPLIAANTHIPAERHGTYSTTRDDQDAVLVQIYNGDLRPESKIGEFRLGGIPPAPAGEPEIEVTFAIDQSCVLEVTARDRKTGNLSSITVSDTTLLSPGEVSEMALRHRLERERETLRTETAALRERLAGLADEAGHADAEALLKEFRTRLAAHRPGGVRQDPRTERVLTEIYGPAAAELETELASMRGPLLDLTTKAREYLGTQGPDLSGDLAEGRLLLDLLGALLARLRPALAQVTLWNAVLGRITAGQADPLRRFRGLHATGDYAHALAARAELGGPLDDPEDVRRELRCLAETGAADAYRRTLIANADRLGAAVLDPAGPGAFLRRVRPALVRTASGGGFLISDRLVVTGRDPGTEVETSAGRRRVGHVFAPESPHLGVVLLQLAEPVPAAPLRLGHAGLVRVGDPVHAVGASDELLLSGVVDSFEAFPEQGLRLYRTGLPAPPDGAGGPLLNGLGEVVGVLTGGAHTGGATFAVTVDDLATLLAGAGFGATGP